MLRYIVPRTHTVCSARGSTWSRRSSQSFHFIWEKAQRPVNLKFIVSLSTKRWTRRHCRRRRRLLLLYLYRHNNGLNAIRSHFNGASCFRTELRSIRLAHAPSFVECRKFTCLFWLFGGERETETERAWGLGRERESIQIDLLLVNLRSSLPNICIASEIHHK